MQADRDPIEFLIERVACCLAEMGITAYDEALIQGVAQEIAMACGAGLHRRSSDTTGSMPAATAIAGGTVAYMREEIDRFNRAAESYFREKTVQDPLPS